MTARISSLWVAPALAALLGCASSQYPDIDEPMPPGVRTLPSEPAAPAPTVAARPIDGGTLQRADVEKVVDAGLGQFLSQVAVEPSLKSGKFKGWSIVAQPDAWRGIDLRPGDVVTRINGMAIEREVEAYDAFQAVRQAPSLEVSYLRDGELRTLRYTIVGAPSIPKAAPPPSSQPPSPKPAPT